MLGPGEAPPKTGTMETGSWKGAYRIAARLPETREFLVADMNDIEEVEVSNPERRQRR